MGPPSIVCFVPVSSSTSSPVPIVIASMFSLQELEENSGWCFFWQCASYSSEHRRNGVYVYDILCQDVTLEFGICIEWQRFTPLTSVSLFSRQGGRGCDVKKHKRHKFISPLSGHFPPPDFLAFSGSVVCSVAILNCSYCRNHNSSLQHPLSPQGEQIEEKLCAEFADILLLLS